MRRTLFIAVALAVALYASTLSYAQEPPKVGGYEQLPPGPTQEEEIGAGWGHRSMTFGMMNLMSGMTTQIAGILRSGKATPEMLRRLSNMLDHVAWMLNYAPAYMMGTKSVDSAMMKEMQDMLKDLESMRKETRAG